VNAMPCSKSRARPQGDPPLLHCYPLPGAGRQPRGGGEWGAQLHAAGRRRRSSDVETAEGAGPSIPVEAEGGGWDLAEGWAAVPSSPCGLGPRR